jgi:SsrA-binding protein
VKRDEVRDLAVNRRARFEYHIDDQFEAGLSLLGSEVKSVRAGKVNLSQAYVRLTPAGASLVGAHIATYEQANRNNHEPLRERRLLLHRHELEKLRKGLTQKGMTIVPLRLLLRGSLIKLEIGLARGKKLHDKREALKERTHQREMDRR